MSDFFTCCNDAFEDVQKPNFNEEKNCLMLYLYLKGTLAGEIFFTCCIDTFEDELKPTFNEKKLANALPLIKSNFSW